MAQFSNFADTPDGIIKEGQEITIKFKRNGDGTATVSWNIPPPANGCSADTQAYDGIVITIDTKAANYRSTSPVNATMYVGDPTANADIHAGDTLDTALIEGAFYNDKTTTSLTITDVDSNKFYYVSGYAVDNVGTYHREGVHAYSLPTGEAETPMVLYNAYQDISLISKDSSKISLNTLTGLSATQNYVLHVKIDNVDNYITIAGVNAQTYFDLINELNKQFKLITGDSYKSPLPPNANQYYLDVNNKTLYFWDGTKNISTGVVFFDQDPNTKPQGTYWVNPEIPNAIKMYETGGWSPQPFISLDHDPREPSCGELWFTGTDAYEFDGDHWCQLCLYIQTRNPSLAPILDCSTFWFDTTNNLLMKWNFDNKKFDEILAIISAKDPNTLSTGDFWLNETDGKIYRYVSGDWVMLSNVRYDAPDENGNLPTPAPSSYWLNPETQIFYKRSSDNTFWTEINYTMYPTDPLDRKSCDLWWNQSPSVDTLYAWDIVNLSWKVITNFLQQNNDPSLPPNLPNCAVWYNPTTGILQYILRNSCSQKPYIFSLFDPTNPIVGTVWYNPTTKIYSVWDGANWDQIIPIVSPYDPFVLYDGYFWYDPTTKILHMWNGSAWVDTVYSLSPLNPSIGTLWYDTANGELYSWNGTAWIVAMPIITVSLKYQVSKDPNMNGRAYLLFLFNDAGCGHSIEIMPDAGGLFSQVVQSVIYNDPMLGGNGPASGPMYKQLDVGTDGTPDERRTLQATLRTLLGSTATQVELTKVNFDVAIDNALLQFRKYSSYSVTRNLFFLDAKPNQQTYQMSNKCVGFNKITSVRAIYRMQAGWIRTGLAGNELFGVAALQQLYTVGTFDMLSFGMMSMYMKELEQMFASRIMHQWVESSRELRLFQRIVLPERLLIDANMERTEQDIITNRASALWIQSWALMESKRMLGLIRGKFLNLPGPNGSTSLNGQDLMSQADTERERLMEELLDPAMGNLEDQGLAPHFVIG